jgi:hypothetical protein
MTNDQLIEITIDAVERAFSQRLQPNVREQVFKFVREEVKKQDSALQSASQAKPLPDSPAEQEERKVTKWDLPANDAKFSNLPNAKIAPKND